MITTNPQQLREFFDTGVTKSYEFRKTQLDKLKHALKEHELQITAALKQDLNKPEAEAYASEIGIIYEEINYALKQLKRWMKKKRVSTPISSFFSRSYTLAVPLGVVFIIAPWNYPIQLLITPLIGAIASGNCAVVKPSEYTPAVSKLLAKILSHTFAPNYIQLVEGDGASIVPELINQFTFNHVFFTGSTTVGKSIATLCASKLIPYTLELGGKSPTIVDKNADLKIAAKRIAWAKLFNAGQTCIAPDYVLVDQAIKEQFIEQLKQALTQMHSNSDTFAKIVNQKRFLTLARYIAEHKVVYGGETDINKLYIMPTLIVEPELTSALMTEEIFGPILPIISYSSFENMKQILLHNPNPLALYVFSNDNIFTQQLIEQIQFGGGCINTALMHIANVKLPFGGVMASGQGRYNGKYTFDTFSHLKAIVSMATWFDVFVKYPPYTKLKLALIKWLTRLPG